jgi:IQ motif/SEC7 domain-containing protein
VTNCGVFVFTGTENRDSGVADVEVCSYQCPCSQNQALGGSECVDDAGHDTQIKRSALSNSLLDIHEQCKLLAE